MATIICKNQTSYSSGYTKLTAQIDSIKSIGSDKYRIDITSTIVTGSATSFNNCTRYLHLVTSGTGSSSVSIGSAKLGRTRWNSSSTYTDHVSIDIVARNVNSLNLACAVSSVSGSIPNSGEPLIFNGKKKSGIGGTPTYQYAKVDLTAPVSKVKGTIYIWTKGKWVKSIDRVANQTSAAASNTASKVTANLTFVTGTNGTNTNYVRIGNNSSTLNNDGVWKLTIPQNDATKITGIKFKFMWNTNAESCWASAKDYIFGITSDDGSGRKVYSTAVGSGGMIAKKVVSLGGSGTSVTGYVEFTGLKLAPNTTYYIRVNHNSASTYSNMKPFYKVGNSVEVTSYVPKHVTTTSPVNTWHGGRFVNSEFCLFHDKKWIKA